MNNSEKANPVQPVCEKTITVSGWSGKDKSLTKDEFAKQWTDHVAQIRRISYSLDWQKTSSVITEQVRKQAEIEFDETWAEQNK